MTGRDAISALDNPYRQKILRVLQKGRTSYSDLFSHLEPNGGARGRFNYHLRSLRNADLVRRADSRYYVTHRGEAALTLLEGVSPSTESRHRSTEDSRRSPQEPKMMDGPEMGLRLGLIAALAGGTAAAAGAALPWVSPGVLVEGHPLPLLTGLEVGLGGTLTLLFALAGLVALVVSRKAATALGGVLGTAALLSAVFTIWALLGGIAQSYLVDGVRAAAPWIFFSYPWASPPGVPPSGLGYGLYLSVAGASILVLGASWAFRAQKTMAALAGSTKTKLTRGVIVGLIGGAVALAGTFLPWVWVDLVAGLTARWTWNGVGVGIGGILTLVFVQAGLVALAHARRATAALGAVLGILALLAALLTLSAIGSDFLPQPLGRPVPPYWTYDQAVEHWRPLGWAVGYGLYVSLVGASIFVLGAAWTFRERKTLGAGASTDNAETTGDDPPSNSIDMLPYSAEPRWRTSPSPCTGSS